MLSANPLVSCVMPTADRRAFIAAAIDCWLKQTYENRELIIVDDGSDSTEDLAPHDERIRYVRFNESMRKTLGAKRNYCNSLARGELICHFDTDDYLTPDRIEFQVDMLKQCGKQIVGFGPLYFWDVVKLLAKHYKPTIPNYICGTTFMYLKSFWEGRRFPDKQMCSDNEFIYPILREHVAASADANHMVARIHSAHHTSPKSAVRDIVDKNKLPSGFWENEELRLNGWDIRNHI